MIRRLSYIKLCAIGLAAALFVSGCAGTGARKSTHIDPDVRQQANELIRQGDHAKAAALYEGRAAGASGENRTALLLAAARQYLLARNIMSAERIFSDLRRPVTSRELATEYRILHGELLVAQGRHQQAYDTLGPQPGGDVSVALRVRYYSALAGALAGLNQAVYEADARMKLADIVSDDIERLYNQQRLIELLAGMTPDQRDRVLRLSHQYAAGWVALAEILKTGGPDRALEYEQWRQKFPNHPAASGSGADSFSYQGPVFATNASTTVGVILPFSGTYSKGANALREGIMAALFSLPAERRPALRFYDTGIQTDVLAAYQQAVNEGAQFIIGPLTKEEVDRLKQAGSLSAPVLAINQTPEPSPVDMFQFALRPEDEGRQVAERAAREGLRNGAVLYPNSGSGARYLDGFRDQLQQRGGYLTAAVPYDQEQNDFAQPVREAVSGKPDFIYVIARPLKARQLRTQIQFFGAATTPVYLSAQALQDMQPGSRNPDLEGARAPGMPWLVAAPAREEPATPANPDSTGILPPAAASPVGMLSQYETDLQAVRDGVGAVEAGYATFFAMGFDALRLASDTSQLTGPFGGYQGATGRLSADANGVIQREPAWITFVNGRPQLLPTY